MKRAKTTKKLSQKRRNPPNFNENRKDEELTAPIQNGAIYAIFAVCFTKIVKDSMPRQKNDGRGRMGGRAKGTPNKATADLREWVKKLVDDNREQIVKDLRDLTPRERLMFIEKLLRYAIPSEPAPVAPAWNPGGELLIGFDDDE